VISFIGSPLSKVSFFVDALFHLCELGINTEELLNKGPHHALSTMENLVLLLPFFGHMSLMMKWMHDKGLTSMGCNPYTWMTSIQATDYPR